jgi:microcystin-dependent protein
MIAILRNAVLRGSAALLAAGGITFISGAAHACGQTPYWGEICVFAGSYCPSGYFQVQGQQLQVSANQGLYYVIANIYGGTYGVNFNLPDLRGRSPVATGQGPGLYQVVTLGETRGAEAQTLTPSKLPSQVTGQVTGMTATSSLAVGETATPVPPAFGTGYTYMVNATAAAPSHLNGLFTATQPTGPTATVPVTTTVSSSNTTLNLGGQSAPVATLPPQLGLTYCIVGDEAYDSTFPPRP